MSKKNLILYTLFFCALCIFLSNTHCFCLDFGWYNEELYLKNARKLTSLKITKVDSRSITASTLISWFTKPYVIKELLKGDTTNVIIATISENYKSKITVYREEILGIKEKSPIVTGIWGLVGFGNGHYYAGDPSTGFVLQTIDIVSLVAIPTAGVWSAIMTGGNPTVFCICLSTLIATRIYGIIDAPKVAERYNRKVELEYGLSVVP